MKTYLHTGPRGKFVGVMESSIRRVIATSTKEVEVTIWSDTGPQVINLRLSHAEAGYLADSLNSAMKETPSVV